MLHWTKEEDDTLRALIAQHGTKKWSLIAAQLQTKSSKQCRRRWKNSLDMAAKNSTWTPQEDALLIRYHRELGNKWTQISKQFGDRTDNAVKNRWHALCRKQPELNEEESPVTTVGVRRGTRTRQEDDFSDDPGYSEENLGQSRKRRRVGTGGGGGGSGGSRGTASTSITEGGRSYGRNNLETAPSVPPFATVGGRGSGRVEGFLPTPFDRNKSILGGGSGGSGGGGGVRAPVIEVAELPPRGGRAWKNNNEVPAGIGGGGGSGGGSGGFGPLESWLQTLNLPGSGSFGGGDAAHNQSVTDWLNLNLNWMNSTTAAMLPSMDLAAGANGGMNIPSGGGAVVVGVNGGESNSFEKRSRTRSLTESGSLNPSLSSSSGLSSGQRELLARLFSQARDSGEQQQQQQSSWQLPSLPLPDRSDLHNAGEQHSFEAIGGGTSFQNMLSLGLTGSLSLGLSAGGASFLQFGGSRSDPVGRTRSSSFNRPSGLWAETAAAAVAAVDGAAAAAAAAQQQQQQPQEISRQLSRGRRIASGGAGNYTTTGGGGGDGASVATGNGSGPIIGHSLTSQDVNFFLEALRRR